MEFIESPLGGGLRIIELDKREDSRGFFARTVCEDDFKKQGLNPNFVQQSISFNPSMGTLRGMHWQIEPFGEEKLVRVTSGAIFDVVVDINPKSINYKRWFAIELSQENRRQIYIPVGYAHGFQTLRPDTEVQYEMTTKYKPESSAGFAWDDSTVGITWPIFDHAVIIKKDSAFLNLDKVIFG